MNTLNRPTLIELDERIILAEVIQALVSAGYTLDSVAPNRTRLVRIEDLEQTPQAVS